MALNVHQPRRPRAGLEVVRDYRGVSVVSAYGPLEFDEVTWAVMAEIDEAEVRQPLVRIRDRAVLAGLIGVALASLLGVLVLTASNRVESAR